MPRLFVAIDLPADITTGLGDISCGLPGARWVPPDQLHLTLRFIGDVDGGVFADVREVLAGVRSQSFSLRIKGVGFFPPRKRPRVIWAGIESSDELILLQKRVENTLVACGLAPEGRKFSPHITLARLKNTPLSRITGFLAQHALLASRSFTVDRFLLYSSVLGRSGAKHYVEEEYLLQAAGR
ncbi:RNA 2',3'-cyclic phosphodiesterase [Desulfolithobacter sp.]